MYLKIGDGGTQLIHCALAGEQRVGIRGLSRRAGAPLRYRRVEQPETDWNQPLYRGEASRLARIGARQQAQRVEISMDVIACAAIRIKKSLLSREEVRALAGLCIDRPRQQRVR